MFNTFWIDPGHGAEEKGGFDKGAIVDGNEEYKMNLWTALEFREYIKAGRCRCKHIRMTRDSNIGPTLYRRMRLPKAGDFYFSIHYNGFNRPAYGGELWVQSKLLQTYKKEFEEFNKHLKSIYEENGYKWRGIKDASRWGSNGMFIEKMKVPAMLWEVGFIKWDFDYSDFDQFHTPTGALKKIIDDFTNKLYLNILLKMK
jgi:N-acetylmuramoyl-L-alanine amidase